jgi:hypothetical protein
MNRRRFFPALAAFVVAITALSFTIRTQPVASSKSAQDAGQPQGPDIPDEVAYRHLFRYVAAIKKQAEEAERHGKDASSYRTHFKRLANLSDYHAQALDDAATQYMTEVLPVDLRARQLIEAYRAQYPNGKVPHGQNPAPPPAELEKLREERDAITLRHRDNLRGAFGDEEFNDFHNKFVKRRIAQSIQPAESNQ